MVIRRIPLWITNRVGKSATERDEHAEPTTSHASSDPSRASLPNSVELRMKRLLASAMQETSMPFSGSKNAIPCGKDALEEFSPMFSTK
ncbi:hypothetical protein KIN20_012828 [Parelaphostrongylus tenuis]|uniref:Uncharacterized protein n=1 Tax=Parelaphostrongylus tenuis TaxID=148309 RepID=A0AAD5MTV9_PARTN|nr:hypothetical protein KIN20_012828 [Parelaphostrongylus tenuis]